MPTSFFSAIRPCLFGLAFVHMWIYCSTHRFLESAGVSVTVVLYSAMSAALILLGILMWRRREALNLRQSSLTPNPVAPSADARVASASASASPSSWPVRLPHPATVDWVASVLMAVGGVALSVPLPAVPPAMAAGVGAALGGVGVVWAYGRWVQVYARLDLHVAAPLIFLTMVLGSSCKTVIDFLPPLPAAVVFACLPFALFACARRSLATVPAAPAAHTYYNRRTIGSLGRVVCGVAAFSFTMGIIQAVFLESRPDPYVASVLVNHGTEILVALAFFWWVAVKHGGLDFGRTWRVILILMITALVFESFFAGTPVHAALFALMRTAHALLVVYFLFLAISDVARHGSYEPLAVYAVGWLAYTLPFTLGNVAGGAMAGTAFEPFVTSVAVWALVVTALILLDDRSLGNQLIFAELNGENEEDVDALARRAVAAQQALDGQHEHAYARAAGTPGPSGTSGTRTPANDLRPRCQTLARKHGLTSREAEVLELLVRGHSKTRIAETFLISENTVRGHVKHIYAKLGVHSKQELLDAFEGR